MKPKATAKMNTKITKVKMETKNHQTKMETIDKKLINDTIYA